MKLRLFIGAVIVVAFIGQCVLEWTLHRQCNAFTILPQTAAMMRGGEEGEEEPDGERYNDRCCRFKEDCDLTELTCSQNSSFVCQDGAATSYRIVLAANRDYCQHGQPSIGRSCWEIDEDSLECAYQGMCVWDSQIDKCVLDEDSPVTVPADCVDNCSL